MNFKTSTEEIFFYRMQLQSAKQELDRAAFLIETLEKELQNRDEILSQIPERTKSKAILAVQKLRLLGLRDNQHRQRTRSQQAKPSSAVGVEAEQRPSTVGD